MSTWAAACMQQLMDTVLQAPFQWGASHFNQINPHAQQELHSVHSTGRSSQKGSNGLVHAPSRKGHCMWKMREHA